MSRSRHSIRLILLLLAVAATLAACAKTAEQPWSTKDESLGPAADGLARLPAGSNGAILAGDEPQELRRAAMAILLQAADSSNALLRHHAIESLQQAPEQVEPVVRQGLVDDNRAVRFAAAMTVGELELTSLAHLLEPLQHDASPSVQAAAIFGLRRCGRAIDLTPLAAMVRSDDPEVRGNAALVLGLLGDASAVRVLQSAIGHGMLRVPPERVKVVELQMIEALVRLGHEESIASIRAALFSPGDQGEITALACQIAGELRDHVVEGDLQNLATRTGRYQHSAEVRMAATLALAKIGASTIPWEVPLGYAKAREFQLRQQAAHTLGYWRDRAALPPLRSLLGDENPLVQVAAAGSVIRLTSDPREPVAAGRY